MRWTVLLLTLWIGGCGAGPGDDGAAASRGGAPEAETVEELFRLYESRDIFALRDRLSTLDRGAPDAAPELRFLRAVTAHAFNRPERSNAVLDSLLAEDGPRLADSLRFEALRLRARNLLRLHRYPDAAAAFERAVAAARLRSDSAAVVELENSLCAMRALGDVPPQRVAARAPTTLERSRRGEVPVSVAGSSRRYGFDTGANLSLLVRSEAEALGLEVRPAGITVGSSTDRRVTADLAVAERLALGAVVLRNVVFLVVPDRVFTFPGHGLVLRGLLGFPVIEALGQVRFGEDGTVEIPGRTPAHTPPNLALHELTPLVRVGYRGGGLVCALDTGNDRTRLLAPVLSRHRNRIDSLGVRDSVTFAGAGGGGRFPSYRLPEVVLEVAGEAVTLADVHVLLRPLPGNEDSGVLDCNLGRDVLSANGAYTIDFRSMSLLLR